MYLARIKKRVISVQKHEAYQGRTVFVVRPIEPDGTEIGSEWVAVDYVGSGVGDIVICGGAPGVAKSIFKIELAPIRTMIMAIIDKINI